MDIFRRVLGLSLILLAMGAPAPAGEPPLVIRIEPQREIFTRREGLLIRFNFRATQPVRLCLEKDPLTQFSLKIFHSGQGPKPLSPLVIKDTRLLYEEPLKVFRMNPGDAVPYRVNLKRIQFADGTQWQPGDYVVEASFHLCGQGNGKETLVPAVNQGRFMIME